MDCSQKSVPDFLCRVSISPTFAVAISQTPRFFIFIIPLLALAENFFSLPSDPSAVLVTRKAEEREMFTPR